jgi:hypothetical protein
MSILSLTIQGATAMLVIDIPDSLPPAITPLAQTLELLIGQYLDKYDATGLVARTWQWILHGDSPRPISQTRGMRYVCLA